MSAVRLLLSTSISSSRRRGAGGAMGLWSVVNNKKGMDHRMLPVAMMTKPTTTTATAQLSQQQQQQRYYYCSSHETGFLATSATLTTKPTTTLLQKSLLSTITSNNNSSAAAAATSTFDDDDIDDVDDGPWGDLFHAVIGVDVLVGKTANILRTFGPRSNAQGFLVCGGKALAKHASFDPDYVRAQGWIRHHAVGPAVLSPVLISGLVGALVEAALPQSVPVRSTMHQLRPLIVGVEVCAKIEVIAVVPDGSSSSSDDDDNNANSNNSNNQHRQQRQQRQHGYQIELNTLVSRVQDDVAIAEGRHYLWIPDYLHM